MKTQIIEYRDDEYDVVITVKQATLADGLRRQAKIAEMVETLKKEEAQGETRSLIERFAILRLFPECTIGTANIENRDANKKQLSTEMSIADFLELPEALVVMWQTAIYACNPQWILKMEGEAQEPGKKN